MNYAMFSLTKLLFSVLLELGAESDMSSETHIARSMQGLRLQAGMTLASMHGMRYVLKRRLVRIAWRVCEASLLLDGDRVAVSAKIRRYLEVVCFLFDFHMLGEVAALRMTCKSNSERRRFPVCFVSYQELEANLIEEWIGYGSSRFVSTDIIHAVMDIHRHYYL